MISPNTLIATGLLCLSLLISCTISAGLPGTAGVSTIYEFPNNTWVENLAVRTKGQILVTLIESSPKIWQIDPFTTSKPVVIHQWLDKTALMGIAEVEPDVFAVATGNLSLQTLSSTPASYEVWRIDLRGDAPTVSLVTRMPEARMLNGVTAVDGVGGTVLIADSQLGAIWSVDTRSGNYAQIIQDSTMAPAPGSPLKLGINGIHVFRGDIYFDDTTRKTFVRLPRDASGQYSAPGELVANLTIAADDFTFDPEGNAYIAGSNRVTKVSPSGAQSVFSNAAAILGSTAVAWGRTAIDSTTLYVTTNGGIRQNVKVHGGRLVAIHV